MSRYIEQTSYLILCLLAVIGLLIFSSVVYSATLCGSGTSTDDELDGGDTDNGGVSFNATATYLGSLSDINGVAYDPDTEQIIFYGPNGTGTVSDTTLDDFVVALRALNANQHPGISLDPISTFMNATYDGQTYGTHMGQVMFDADVILKWAALGRYYPKDPMKDETFKNNIEIFPYVNNDRSLVYMYAIDSEPHNTVMRTWFEPMDMQLKLSADKSSLFFNSGSMVVHAKETANSPGISNDPIANEFATHFTDHYQSYMNKTEFSALKALLSAAKTSSFAQWIIDNKIPVDDAYISSYTPKVYNTPSQAPMYTYSDHSLGINSASGGVIMIFEQATGNLTYITDSSGIVNSIKSDAVTVRNNNTKPDRTNWSFNSSGGLYNAVAHSLMRSRKDGNVQRVESDMSISVAGDNPLEFARYYSSFSDKSSALGRGWDMLPYSLSFPGDGSIYVRAKGKEHRYTKSDGVYRRPGGKYTLDQSNGTYTLSRDNMGRVEFNADGNVARIYDKNEIYITYAYTGSILNTITHKNGSQITLNYNGNNLSSITGPSGRTMTYDYTNGMLSKATNQVGTWTKYEYDSENRLATVKDSKDNAIFTASYDDYHRAESKTVGVSKKDSNGNNISGANISKGFNLKDKTSKTTATNGVEILKQFDKNYKVTKKTVKVDGVTNAETNVSYDNNGFLDTLTKPRGNKKKYGYNSSGKLLSLVASSSDGSRAISRTYEYYDDNKGDLRFAIDGKNVKTEYKYEDDKLPHNVTKINFNVSTTRKSDGLVSSVSSGTSASSISVGYSNTTGKISSITDQEGRIITIDQNDNGQPKYIQKGVSNTVSMSMTYNSRSLVNSTSSGTSQVYYSYDDIDRLTMVNSPAVGAVKYNYDLNGNINTVTDARGYETKYAYDDNNNLIGVSDAANNSTSYAYDTINNLLQTITLPNGTVKTISYDKLNRAEKVAYNVNGSASKFVALTNSIDFGTIYNGASSDKRTKTVKVCNSGSDPLTMNVSSSDSQFAFSYDNNQIDALACKAITVTFNGKWPVDNYAILNATAGQSTASIAMHANYVVSLHPKVTIKQENIELKWSLYNGSDFSRYSIYRAAGSQPANLPAAIANVPSGTTYLDASNLTPGTKYYYTVIANATSGARLSNIEWVSVNYGDLGQLGGLSNITSALAYNSTSPDIAYSYNSNQYLAVYAYDNLNKNTNWDVFGQLISSSGVAIGAKFDIMNSATYNEKTPRVAYNGILNEYMVVAPYTNTTTAMMKMQRVYPNGDSGWLKGAATITNSPCNKAISNSPTIINSPNSDKYFVATESKCNGYSNISYALINSSSNAFFSNGVIANTTSSTNLYKPSVAMDNNGEALIAYVTSRTGFGNSVTSSLINTATHQELWRTNLVSNSPYAFSNTVVAYDVIRDDFAIAFANSAGMIQSRQIGRNGVPKTGVVNYSSAIGNIVRPSLAYSADDEEYLLGYTVKAGGSSYNVNAGFLLDSTLAMVTNSVTISNSPSATESKSAAVYNPIERHYLAAFDGKVGNKSDIYIQRVGALSYSPKQLDFGSDSDTLTVSIDVVSDSASMDGSSDVSWVTSIVFDPPTSKNITAHISISRLGFGIGTHSGIVTLYVNGVAVDIPVSMVVVNMPPSKPTNPIPSSGTLGINLYDSALSVPLSWTASTDPEGDSLVYDVYINSDLSALNNYAAIVNSVDTSSIVSGLGYQTKYYWKAVAKDNNNATASDIWEFTTMNIPAPEIIRSSKIVNTVTPEFRWQPVAGASGYYIENFTDSGVISSAATGNTTSYRPNTALPQGKQYWHVASRDSNGHQGDYSATDDFTIDSIPSAVPVLMDYNPNPTSNLKPKFQWYPAMDAVNYTVQISTDAGFTNVIIERLISNTYYQVVDSLPEGNIYWRVRSFDAVGNASNYSAAKVLRVDATSPLPITGLTAVQEGSAIRLNWSITNSVDDFKQYNIYRSTSDPITDVSSLVPIAHGLSRTVITYKDSSVIAGAGYYYAVTATDTAGNEAKSVVGVGPVTIDTSKPSSTISNLYNGEVLIGNSFVINGTASSPTNAVQKVEISLDGGGTWIQASGTTSWSYNWIISSEGLYTIKTRATDSVSNVEVPSNGVTVRTYNRQPSSVTINNKTLYINGNPFQVKGVVYSPTPIGKDPDLDSPYGDYFTADYAGIYGRDLPILRGMGSNTVRLLTWDNSADHLAFLDQAYNNGVNPIYVIPEFKIKAGLDIDPNSQNNVREQLKSDFRYMVSAYKKHPAILMWSIGSGLNSSDMYGDDPNLFSLIDELSNVAHAEEGAAYHPVTIPLEDDNLAATITSHAGSSIDVWGVNVYRGNTFGSLFADLGNIAKPILILEFGIDAYDDVNQDEYENLGIPYQSTYASSLWAEIAQHSNMCVGGVIMEYSDEWWKGALSPDTTCSDNLSDTHGECGYPSSVQPDAYSNDEWWGIVRISLDPASTDAPNIIEPRVLFYSLQDQWSSVQHSPNMQVTPSSIDFGSIGVNGISQPRTITIKNTGSDNLSINNLSISGNNSNQFRKLNDGCSGHTLAPNKSCTLQLEFVPTELGVKNTNLSTGTPTATGTGTVTLTVSINPSGAGTVSGNGISCPGDCTETIYSTLQLQAIKNDGYIFKNWTGTISPSDTISSASNPAQFSGNGNIELSANFYNVIANSTGNGSVSCSLSTEVNDSVICTFSPQQGFIVVSVTADGIQQIPVPANSYTFNGLTIGSTHTIDVVFAGYVKIEGTTPTYYATLQSAYDVATSGSVISAQTHTFNETLNANRNISITINGGYDSSYSQIIGTSIINGITISNSTGAVTIGGFDLN